MPSVPALLDSLRRGAFVTRERLVFVPAALLAAYAVALAFMLVTAHGSLDYQGRPLGTDFSNVYAAGTAVLAGHPEAPFDPARQRREEESLFGRATPFYGWHYPPYFLLLAAPLATLPYLAALGLYQLATLALYLAALAALLRGRIAERHWLPLALAFPAVFVNLTHGNNGFLTAALLAAGLAVLERRPLLAGVLFGCLVYKPQFVMLIPLALAAGGHWRTILAGTATVLTLSGLVTLAFGPEVWSAFLASTHFARTVVLEQGGTGFHKIQSVFAWVRLWGGSVALAYAVQGIVSAAAALGLMALWRKPARSADKGAALCLAALLATPYCLDYDLAALAPALALLAARGLSDGFRPFEKSVLAGLWLVPVLTREAAATLLLPLGTIAMLALAGLLARDAGRRDGPAEETSAEEWSDNQWPANQWPANQWSANQWSEREDSNLRPPRPERGALPG